MVLPFIGLCKCYRTHPYLRTVNHAEFVTSERLDCGGTQGLSSSAARLVSQFQTVLLSTPVASANSFAAHTDCVSQHLSSAPVIIILRNKRLCDSKNLVIQRHFIRQIVSVLRMVSGRIITIHPALAPAARLRTPPKSFFSVVTEISCLLNSTQSAH